MSLSISSQETSYMTRALTTKSSALKDSLSSQHKGAAESGEGAGAGGRGGEGEK